jgi:hypothetical protein
MTPRRRPQSLLHPDQPSRALWRLCQRALNRGGLLHRPVRAADARTTPPTPANGASIWGRGLYDQWGKGVDRTYMVGNQDITSKRFQGRFPQRPRAISKRRGGYVALSSIICLPGTEARQGNNTPGPGPLYLDYAAGPVSTSRRPTATANTPPHFGDGRASSGASPGRR